jgi:cellulose synthase/poly-beta-1,6-N-acetylglucosamine synthase-like glycosyltransferase
MTAVGRNLGARAAVGDLILFLDADVLPPTDFIVRIMEEFEQKGFDIAACYIAETGEDPLDRMLCMGTNLYYRIIHPVSPHAPGFCIMAKRTAHEEMGGFDESLILSEDIDYARGEPFW